MAIRETIHNNGGIAMGVAIGIIAIAIIAISVQLGGAPGDPSERWFTTDDSSPEAALQALFVDDAGKYSPFDKDGKKAYVAHVYSCDGGKTKFVAYLERYTESAKAKMEEFRQQGMDKVDGAEFERTLKLGVEVKVPGPGPWVQQTNEMAETIMAPTCSGDSTLAHPVYP